MYGPNSNDSFVHPEYLNNLFQWCCRWKGEGAAEVGMDRLGRILVSVDPLLHVARPIELNYLRGDASQAALLLGWRPSCTFKVRHSPRSPGCLEAVLAQLTFCYLGSGRGDGIG